MREHVANSTWDSYLPHGQSYFWAPEILWTQALSDCLIALAFFSIPFTLLFYFWRRRHELKLQSVYILVIFFIFACGLSHAFDLVVIWLPIYQYQAAVKFIAAVASVATALFVWPLLPDVLSKPSWQMLEEAEQAEGRATDKYNLLLAGSGVGVYEWHDLKNRNQPIYWSDRMYELLGFKPGSFLPTINFYLSLIHPDDRHFVHEILNSSVTSTALQPIEYRVRVRSHYRWFKARTFTKLNSQSRILFMIGSVEDIHKQKQAEEQIRNMNANLEEEIHKRTLQLEQASHAKTRVLANMSHEIRTPLGLILGFSELISENRDLEPETREYVELIQKNGEILSRIINDLLDLSKIEAGKLQFQYAKVSLNDLLTDFQKAFGEKAATKGIHLSFENLCPNRETVVTDEIRLKQIIYNLLSNAIKFTNQGHIYVTFGKRNQHYTVDVIDTGIGIYEEDKDRIFEEFMHGEMTDTGRQVSAGLGLQLAQSLAKALGGQIELVSSQVSRGSHFRLTFISDEKRLQHQTERNSDAKISSKLNDFEVFVLDDNEDNIRLADIFLKKLGCRVRGFTSAQSLFAEMVSSNPDLILLDINMPEMNGFEVFDRIRQSGYKNPIWALTAYSLNEDIQAILDHGFDDYIRKPIGLDVMKRKLTAELREHGND